MPVAAVPAYLGRKFEDASPGMRFGMYFRGWKRDFSIAAKEKLDAYRSTGELSSRDRELLKNLALRQQALFSCLDSDSSCVLYAIATAPFTTGLGNDHPLENGFAFLWPYGLPYLPGSGVKGVLRQAARELAAGLWGDNRGWTEEAITVLFGSEDSNDAHRGALTFWDVIPQIKGDALAVEVMTPHQSHYYQGKEPPHDSGQPNPIYFLTVPAESGFDFYVTCNPALLEGTAFRESWRASLQVAFEHAFDWLGFGAKTAVGYGAMRIDAEAEEERRQEEEQRREAAEREARFKEATAGLPEDAAELEKWRLDPKWQDNNLFLEKVEEFLAAREPLSREALSRIVEEMEQRWKGIMANPDAIQGKKKKPKFKARPRELAKRILALETKS